MKIAVPCTPGIDIATTKMNMMDNIQEGTFL